MEEEEKPVKKPKAEPVNVKKEAVAAVVAPIKKEEKKAQPQQKQAVKEVAKKEEVVVKKEAKEPKKEVAKKEEKKPAVAVAEKKEEHVPRPKNKGMCRSCFFVRFSLDIFYFKHIFLRIGQSYFVY